MRDFKQLKDIIYFQYCKNYSNYTYIDKNQYNSMPLLLNGNMETSCVTTTMKNIVFNDVFCDKIIYDNFLKIINSDKIKTIEKDVYGMNDMYISHFINQQLDILSFNIGYDVNFIILNSYYYMIINHMYYNNPMRLNIIIDDNLDYIIIGRTGHDINESPIVCFNDGENMCVNVTNDDAYDNYVKIKPYNSIEIRKKKIKKIIKNSE